MRSRSTTILVSLVLVMLGLPAVIASTTANAATGNRQISAAGTAAFHSVPLGVDAGIQNPEFRAGTEGAAAPAPAQDIINRSETSGRGGAGVDSDVRTGSRPTLSTSFDGLNFRQQRLANGGNQFSVEPPDQGLCASSGYVMEAVNDVLRVFDTAGNALLGVTDLNTFYGYPAQINRTTGQQGPFVTDPSCYYDQATQRWFLVVLTLEVDPSTGDFLGPNHLDIAVSQSSSPLGSWTIYRLAVQDDGTDGTPNHNCAGGACIGDYPHIGADAYGFYITTNEYPFFADGFHGAQLYALSKAALAANASTLTVTQFDTAGAVAGNPGFTVWPATSPGVRSYSFDRGGTEYFLSSNAAEEANGTGTSNQLIVWALTNTRSLNSASPAVTLSHRTLRVNRYGMPPSSDQKAGDYPLGQCLNDTSCSTFLLGAPDPFAPEPESNLDSNDTRMQQVTYADGTLWGALDTALTTRGVTKAGIAWYIVRPSVSRGSVTAGIVRQGYLGVRGNNVTYPAIGVTASGRGVIAFTLVGADHYPTAAYAGLDADHGVGSVRVAAEGAGPQDGFTGYRALVGDPPRPRWGDYGATAVVGSTVWLASEYIGQTCTLAQYETAPFGSCGGTRATLGNWATRISSVTP